jgi:hypothetical protein
MSKLDENLKKYKKYAKITPSAILNNKSFE